MLCLMFTILCNPWKVLGIFSQKKKAEIIFCSYHLERNYVEFFLEDQFLSYELKSEENIKDCFFFLFCIFL